jgi:formylglycine-generating enzyme
MRRTLAITVYFTCATFASAAKIDMVTVGNPGNAPDTRYNNISVGSVGYIYQIGKCEVTAGQYTEFLNAVAKADPNGLYNMAMGNPSGDQGANIQRSGSSPNFTYSVAADWANRPVNYVSFWDAARFANWLHNGQPIGPQGSGTTEDGAYHDVGNQALFGRNAGGTFFIPTQDEWYKAAYHKNDGLTGNYWDYPTASNTLPINTLPDTGNHANFFDDLGTGNHNYTIGSPYYRTEVGAFQNSPSPYGTFDQGGNIVEWTESVHLTSTRIVRGGSYRNIIESPRMKANNFGGASPALEFPFYGFRIASAVVPEPSTNLLTIAAFAALQVRRRRSTSRIRV